MPATRAVAGQDYNVNPIQIIGNGVYFLLRKPLQYGQAYSVTVDNGMLADETGNAFSIGADGWSFPVRAAAPTSGPTSTVASDGSGDYCTIQGALDAIPSANASRRTLNISNGAYPGLMAIEKDQVTLRGTGRLETILANSNSSRSRLPATRAAAWRIGSEPATSRSRTRNGAVSAAFWYRLNVPGGCRHEDPIRSRKME